MVGCKIRLTARKPAAEWVNGLLESKFFDVCLNHGEMRRNEKNLFCIDCSFCFCKHCVTFESHDCLHRRLLQICKYVYRDVVRLHDIQPYLDCSLIQAYKINGEKAVHLNPRPQIKSPKTKGGGSCCRACRRHIQDLPNRFCSIACKVSVDAETRIKRSNNNIMSTTISNIDQIPSLETEENSYDSSSEVIQAWWGPSLRPKKMLHKRKSFPRRAPLC